MEEIPLIDENDSEDIEPMNINIEINPDTDDGGVVINPDLNGNVTDGNVIEKR